MSQQLIGQILQTNQRRSEEFRETTNIRRDYRDAHSTEFLFTLCMDGRINIYSLTGLVFGLFNLLRNIGGIYHIGWDLFQSTLEQWRRFAQSHDSDAVVVVTYHWSESDTHAGCAGHNYDLLGSIMTTQKLRDDIMNVYDGKILSVMMGIETDNEAIILHGEEPGIRIDMFKEAATATEERILHMVTTALPSLPHKVRQDLVPILMGNAKHILELQANPRQPHERLHCERVLAIGTGFDWLDQLNFALIIGPCDPDRKRAVTKAAEIIWNNWGSGRIPDDKDGVLLISAACYEKNKKKAAAAKAIETAKSTIEILNTMPHMEGLLKPLVGVTMMNGRRFEVIDFKS